MTIKKRFIISYLSAIAISLISVILILSITLYVTVGKVPKVEDVYKMLTTQRSLTKEEEEAYLQLDSLLKKSPERMNPENNEALADVITSIEATGLEVALRKKNDYTYFSDDLIEKSLIVHALDYELNNFKPVGTIDNAGRLYHYLKKDFEYLDGTTGSFIILKRESTLLEFFTKWGVWVVLVIMLIATSIAIFINRRLSQTTIAPIEKLQQATQMIERSEDLEHLTDSLPQTNITKEVYDLQKSFKDMWLKLQEIDKVRNEYENNRKELIANMSHDLKTPITSIIGYVEGLQDGVANTPEKKEAYLAVIHEKAIDLNHLIEELFISSKLDLEEQTFEFNPVDFSNFVEKIVTNYQTIHPNISWEFNSLATNTCIKIDSSQIERVINNIFDNSIKFYQPSLQPLIIKVELNQSDNFLVLSIEDNGIGIAESDLANVFDRFFRSDRSRTSSIPGSGLGLSIVKQIMLKHKGEVTMESELNKGTTTYLFFPNQ